MRYLHFILFGFLVFGSVVMLQLRGAAATVQEIVAVVNEEVISGRDLDKRMKLVLASSGLPNNAEMRERMAPQIINGLIDERIMLQEARKAGIEVSQDEIQQGFATIAAQNNQEPKQFENMIRKSGLDVSTMYAQVESQVAWSKVVQSRLRPRIIISERDIDAAYERVKAKIGTSEYLTAEIYLPVSDAETEGKVKQLGNRLVREIKGGQASFFKLAQQFSKAAGAARGGDTGWLNEEQIDPALLEALRNTKKNGITHAVKTPGGYNIMLLRDMRTMTEETMPSRDQIEYGIGTDRLNKLQHRHLMDLRAAAFIDIRV